MEFTLKQSKQTSGTVVYAEVDKETHAPVDRGRAVFPALYLPKRMWPDGKFPDTVKVTLEI